MFRLNSTTLLTLFVTNTNSSLLWGGSGSGIEGRVFDLEREKERERERLTKAYCFAIC